MAKGNRIHLPLNKASKPRAEMDPFFPVETMRYLREDGKDEGLRAIVNSLTKDTLGRVSEGYKVITHKEASNIVRDTLEKVGIKYTANAARCGNKGARFFEEIAFPELAFNPATKTGITSTALDALGSGGHNMLDVETFVPFIKARNSYNGTQKLAWTYGFARPWCSNGVAIITQEDTLAYKHNQEIDLDNVKILLLDHLNENNLLMEQVYERLNNEKGTTYLQALINGDFPDKFKLAVIEKIAPHATIKSKTIDGEEGKKKIMEIESITTKASAWAVWNVATDVSTHLLPNVIEQDKVDRRIARAFKVQ